MKNLVILAVFCVMHLYALAAPKKKNTLTFHTENIYYIQSNQANSFKYFSNNTKESLLWIFGPYISQFGLSFNKKIFKNYSICIKYTMWNKTQIKNQNYPESSNSLILRNSNMYSLNDCKYIDLGIDYTLLNKKKHEVSLGIGMSYLYGYTKYYDSLFFYKLNIKEFNSLGIIPSVRYKYKIFKGKANLGLDFQIRKYKNIGDNTFYSLGYSFGFNF